MPIDVFISYRGADRILARRLEQRLRSRWGSRVFRDETSLVAGRPWSDQLREAMTRANVMLALVGPGWYVRDEGKDWVRDELLGAIEAGNPVLPVLVDDPDGVNSRLSKLPEAFGRQAVKVSADLAGFDLHKIERALRALGAFGERRSGGLGDELSRILPARGDEVIGRLAEGRSILVSGTSGSGRSTLLRRIADAAGTEGGLVASHGTNLRARSRRTHAVVASWVDDLGATIQGLAPEDRNVLGPALVDAVIRFGPDLLARQVLRPALLLTLGGDDSDQRILDAARRPLDRWTPFPPERLVSQSVSVIREFAERSGRPLTLIVDNVESLDGSSRDLVERLLERRLADVRLVLATSAIRESAEPEPVSRSIARALRLDAPPGSPERFAPERFESISLHGADTWGEPGEIIRSWLERHEVRLDEGIGERFERFNPYYALSALWYLVDNGHLVEEEVPEEETGKADVAARSREERRIVTWVAARADEDLVVPARERLLDHMIEEFVPARFRAVVETGALIGRRFPFSAAFAVAEPPESVDGQPPTAAALDRWRALADAAWADIERIDPDGSVLVCHRSADEERMIGLAQADLVTHLASGLTDADSRRLHEGLARYFAAPFAEDLGTSLDDRYRNARAAASHWASARRTRPAADAEREAAELAERALAYPEALRHYRRAIRLFTQLLARTERRSTVDLVDHEDLLILADCLYRLGHMARLAHERGSAKGEAIEPTRYFRLALRRLRELSDNLHDKRLTAPSSGERPTASRRDLPEPNRIRHHIRLCETLSGWVNVELAEWHRDGREEDPRQLLFDALRHAEAAWGEADSRWLLAAASARLARHLVDDAARAARAGDGRRSHNLAIEAQFHIERVIGLAAVSPDEERDLEEPRSRAWMVLGQLFRTVKVRPRLAHWAYGRMNEHRRDVSDLVDMMTDRELGLFLLSRYRGAPDDSIDEARELLDRHARWAIESGIGRERSDAHLNLALLALLDRFERPAERCRSLASAHTDVDWVILRGPDPVQRRHAFLLRAALFAIERGGEGGVAHDDEAVLEAFRAGGIDAPAEDGTDADVLHEGWRRLSLYLLHRCPRLLDRIGPDLSRPRPPGRCEAASARRTFFSTLALDPELGAARERTDAYLASATGGPAVPSNDAVVWRLLESRVPRECYEHAERTRATARRLLECHRDEVATDEVELVLLRRDVSYAVVVHEWYRSTDPSRLLTLARESNLRIEGSEWASPKVLSGRLAIRTLDRQYGAAREIGRERLSRVTSMVENWTAGAPDAAALERIFYIAVQMQEPARSADDGEWRTLAERRGRLADAYRGALEERSALVRQAGLPLVQDLHLVDAGATAVVSTEDGTGFDGASDGAADGVPLDDTLPDGRPLDDSARDGAPSERAAASLSASG